MAVIPADTHQETPAIPSIHVSCPVKPKMKMFQNRELDSSLARVKT